MNLFKSKDFTTIMFLAISIVLLLIVFNSIKIFENKNSKSMKNQIVQYENHKIIGLVTENVNKSKNNEAEKEKSKIEEKLHSEKSYKIYYTILIILIICIGITSLAYFLPLVRDYT